jgi:hypothetical protein
MSAVFVFATSVVDPKQVLQLQPHLDELLPDVAWNFDLEDCDKIFRVETTEDVRERLIALFAKFGFWCEELAG